MAIPIISAIIPNSGHTGGKALVEIRGSGFQVPPPPPVMAGVVPRHPPTVRVFFGGAEALNVRVVSTTRLLVNLPLAVAGAVRVEVHNVGKYGETQGSEVAVLVGGFTFRSPQLTAVSTITQMNRVLIDELRRQVFGEVVQTQNVDWADDAEAVARKIASATLPCVLLAGPRLRTNALYRSGIRPVDAPTGQREVREYRGSRPQDLVFTLGALSNNMNELLTLAHLLHEFVQRNVTLTLSPGVAYEFGYEGDGEIQVDSASTQTNVRSALGTVAIRAVRVVGVPGVPGDTVVNVHPTVDQVVLLPSLQTPEE